MRKSKQSHQPRKWLLQAYRLLAAGRYAALWLPELMHLYDLVLREQGQHEADKLVLNEVMDAVPWSTWLRFYRLFRLAYAGWKLYRKIAKD